MRAPREYTDEQLAVKAAAKEAKASKQAEVNRQQAAVDVVLADKVTAILLELFDRKGGMHMPHAISLAC